MIRHIHFLNIGQKLEPPLGIFLTAFPKDTVYLVNSPYKEGDVYSENEKTVRMRLEEIGIRDIKTLTVPVYDFEAIVEKLESAVARELNTNEDCHFHFNITAGTNISAGAMCVVAMSMKNADVYHLREGKYANPPTINDSLLTIDLADSESIMMLETKKHETNIMRIISESNAVPYTNIRDRCKMSSSLLSYHLKILVEYGLIVRSNDNSRTPNWALTEKGKKVFRRYLIRRGELPSFDDCETRKQDNAYQNQIR